MTRRNGVILLFAFLAVAFFLGYYTLLRHPAAPPRPAAADGETITIFYPDGKGRLLKKGVEVRRRLSERARADVLFRELKEARSIPDRLRLHELAAGDDGVLYLDVSKEFIDSATPEREVDMVYAIVNSFAASFPNVQRVQLLVEGEPVYTRSGLLYILDPIEPTKELLEVE
jgi:hypothetical protein